LSILEHPAIPANPAIPAAQQMSAAMSTVASMLRTDPSSRARGHIRLDSGSLDSLPAALERQGAHYEYMKPLGDGIFVRIERNETVATVSLADVRFNSAIYFTRQQLDELTALLHEILITRDGVENTMLLEDALQCGY
jgi:hypothetical protein